MTETQEQTTSYGECDWDEFPSQSPQNKEYKNTNRPSFLKFKNGNNPVRFFTKKARKCAFHKVQIGSNKTVNFKCSDPINKKDCPFCEKGFSIRWHAYLGVISRNTHQAHIVELRPGLITKIQTVRNSDADYSDITTYDMVVVVSENGGPTNYYSAIPKKICPLTANDLELIKDFDEERLSFYCSPPSREKLVENIRSVEEKFGAKISMEPIEPQTAASKPTKANETKTKSGDSEESIEVPDFPQV